MRADGELMTVGRAIRHVLPDGTAYEWSEFIPDEVDTEELDFGPDAEWVIEGTGENEYAYSRSWIIAPDRPPDLFVVVGHLVHNSGLLNYFEPDPDFKHSLDRPLMFTLTSAERSRCMRVGEWWSTDQKTPNLVRRLWHSILTNSWGLPLRASTYAARTGGRRKSTWWKAVLQLLIIADEACVGLGAPPVKSHPNRWVVERARRLQTRPFTSSAKLELMAYRASRQPTTYGTFTDPDVACVQPKGRISEVGCNLRNLSKNVSYISHAGNMRCHWHQTISSDFQEDAEDLDILIIPLPSKIDENAIKPTTLADPAKRPEWGNFKIHQNWLEAEDDVIEHVRDQVTKAKAALTNGLNGVIFPEYALTEALFRRICHEIRLIEPQIEFAISGSSSNCEGEKGNFVLTALWDHKPRKGKNPELARRYILTSRRKHHRWKLTPGQVGAYDLERALPPPTSWWETHDIAQREIHLFHFRKTSVFTTMICEDLARSDPCHDVLRAIGPNLLFAILMDGPQLAGRWPGRYAATLADDPGTSVLTVTSMGLIQRQNDLGRFPENRTVALWRDDTGQSRELALDEGGSSLLLTLKAHRVTDHTLDGRKKDPGWAWHYGNCQTIA